MSILQHRHTRIYFFGASIALSMLIGLPLIGVYLIGMDVTPFLEFPPLTRYVTHADFSRVIFLFIGCIDLMLFGVLFAALSGVARHKGQTPQPNAAAAIFPWWGWGGVSLTMIGWLLAWNRFEWFAFFQRHTFSILWIGYIGTINALCYKRSSTCPLLEYPAKFLMLFVLSACFWWFFEYLNRFVQNWYYLGVENFTAMGYVFFATLSFSTVLPAVYSTYRLLLTFDLFNIGLLHRREVSLTHPGRAAASLLLVAGVGLALIGVWPDFLFPLLWVSPFLIVTALQLLFGEPHVFSSFFRGDWRVVIAGPTAALICGFFWEMWNLHSLAKWEYAIPFVHRFQLFEMPVLGYGGYLPFGLECMMICQLVFGNDLNGSTP